MDIVNTNIAAPDEEISLAEVRHVLRRAKWLVAGFVLVCTLGGVAAAVLLPKMYTATITIAPASSGQGSGQLGGLSSLVSQVGGLASLAGISMAGDSKRAESIAVLQSEALTEKYIQENHLLQEIYKDEWDAQRSRWIPTDPQKIPTLWKANRYFKSKIRTITPDTKTGIIVMTITWKDPVEAARWANDLVKITNDYLRGKAIAESERNIDYLNEQATKTDLLPVRQAIYSILQSEIDKAMLARGSDEYALKVLDPAVAPELPSSFPRVFWMALGLFGSLGLCVLGAFIRVAWGRGQ